MAVLKSKALRDRRPKSEPIKVETDAGNVITFRSPLGRKARAGMDALELMSNAQSREDVSKIFEAMTDNGVDDLDMIIEDDDPELGELLEIIKAVSEEIEKQAGSTVGESRA